MDDPIRLAVSVVGIDVRSHPIGVDLVEHQRQGLVIPNRPLCVISLVIAHDASVRPSNREARISNPGLFFSDCVGLLDGLGRDIVKANRCQREEELKPGGLCVPLVFEVSVHELCELARDRQTQSDRRWGSHGI